MSLGTASRSPARFTGIARDAFIAKLTAPQLALAPAREVEKLANELRIERNKSLEMKVVQVQAETKKESKLGALLERVLKAEQEREAIEKRALAAEREVKQVKQEVQAALIAMDCH